MKKVLAVAAALIFTLSLSAAHGKEILNGAGASFPYPLYSAWAYDYHKATGLRLNYQSIGSGGGQRQITARTVDFGASDAPLPSKKLAKHKLLQFPAVIGGVTPVVNIPGVKPGQLRLDSKTFCKIFLGEIAFWDDQQISTMNSTIKLPHKKITVVHRSDGSGTTAIFTHYLSEVCPAWKKNVGEGKAVQWPTGIGGKGNEGVANYVKKAKYSIGYVEFAYAKQNRLAHTILRNRAGNFVEPNFETFSDAAATAAFEPKKDFYLWLTNAPGKRSWPIAGATFILLAKEKKASNKKTVTFYDWSFKNGDATAKRLIYIPLPQSLKKKIRSYWKQHGIY